MHISPSVFAICFSLFNALVFNFLIYIFAINNIDISTSDGIATIISLFLIIFSVTLCAITLFILFSVKLTKLLSIVITVANSAAMYFMVTYQVILDKDMMGNVFNTNSQESLSYLGASLILYLLFWGILPSILISKVSIKKTGKILLSIISVSALVVTLTWSFYFSSTWLWFDQHGKRLGGTVLPWSYIINSVRYQNLQSAKSQKQELLPAGTLKNSDKQIVVLVIGETARASNFEQYGYDRQTTPHLVQEGAIPLVNTKACATYTTASVRCILSHEDSSSEFATSYEPLPSYLSRHGVDVIWRTNNWGEPKLNVNTYNRSSELKPSCTGSNCDLDEVLLSKLGERITESKANKIFIVLHLKGSHGPEYFDQYPKEFEQFKPVCTSVELNKCTEQELINAYDNSLLYTDYVLFQTIELLKKQTTPSTMMYISDHGESLGEEGLYLHGTPFSLAPSYQTEIPFFVWMSKEFQQQKKLFGFSQDQNNHHSQLNIFHSVLGAFGMESPVYISTLDIFNEFKEKR